MVPGCGADGGVDARVDESTVTRDPERGTEISVELFLPNRCVAPQLD
jgi:hypothetical protein